MVIFNSYVKLPEGNLLINDHIIQAQVSVVSSKLRQRYYYHHSKTGHVWARRRDFNGEVPAHWRLQQTFFWVSLPQL